MRETVLKQHSAHSTAPFPQTKGCQKCKLINSWRQIAKVMYMGDPFSLKVRFLKYIEPEYFRKGAGYWDGAPTW